MCAIVGVDYLMVLLSVGEHGRALGWGWSVVFEDNAHVMARSKPDQSLLSVLNLRLLVGCSRRQKVLWRRDNKVYRRDKGARIVFTDLQHRSS